MNAPTTHPAPEWLRELAAARTHHEELLGRPVTADPGGHWWTFLSHPATAPPLGIPAALRRLRVHPAPQGTPVIIPTYGGGDGHSR